MYKNSQHRPGTSDPLGAAFADEEAIAGTSHVPEILLLCQYLDQSSQSSFSRNLYFLPGGAFLIGVASLHELHFTTCWSFLPEMSIIAWGLIVYNPTSNIVYIKYWMKPTIQLKLVVPGKPCRRPWGRLQSSRKEEEAHRVQWQNPRWKKGVQLLTLRYATCISKLLSFQCNSMHSSWVTQLKVIVVSFTWQPDPGAYHCQVLH